MPLETGSYISDLVVTNPTGADSRRQGDDHLRLIKSILKSTFPNIDGVINVTPAELNKLAGLLTTAAEISYLNNVTSDIQAQLNSKAPVANPTFTGEIGIGSVNVSATELGILEGAKLTTTELNYVDGVTSSIQSQLNAKQDKAITFGSIGTYAMLAHKTPSTPIIGGGSYAGSSLGYSGVNITAASGDYAYSSSIGASPAGTWKAMGASTFTSSKNSSTIFLRIA